MILEFSVENFRSIKNLQTFSMVAESSKIKGENVFEIDLPKGDSVRLLKTAMIYGANASGKSNLIRALGSFIQLIRRRTTGAGRNIWGYDPFKFAKNNMGQPTRFKIVFVFEGVKYIYEIALNAYQIIEEELVHYPKGQTNKILQRTDISNDLLHKIKLGKDFGDKEIEVFSNQLGLNKFGFDIPNENLTKIYLYFDSIEINNALNSASDTLQARKIAQRLSSPLNRHLFIRLERLIRVSDTKIDKIELTNIEELVSRIIRKSDGTTEKIFEKRTSIQIYGQHKVFEDGIEVGKEPLPFNEESEGTKALFWRGGLILETLERGGILVFDELDNSLHPKLVRFLVQLFSNPLSNPNNAQLIFATHEVTLLDRDLFRTDQIWFAEKNQFGETEFFSAQDFEGVREDVPFDKWYMAGKFGGLPKIEDIESVFINE